MNKFFAKTSVQITLSLAAMVVLFYGIWAYVTSFQTVTFTFDDTLGYVEIAGSDKRPLFPKNNQPVRLKKGDYTVQDIGKNITKNSRTVAINSNSDTIKIQFSYTEEYLADLYMAEQPAIHSALLQAYPKIPELYELRYDRLYGKGAVFGATLVAKNQDDDNADALHVLMYKKSDEWRVRSTPPTPILGAPNYPDIPRDILLQINKGS